MPGEFSLPSRVLIPTPRGFCAGVERSIDAMKAALVKYPNLPIFGYHSLIHNEEVTRGFEKQGVDFVNQISKTARGSVTVFSAHGVSPEVRIQAEERGLTTIDATCPLVEKVHAEVRRLKEADYDILLNGHNGHDETVGTLGEAPNHIQVVKTIEDVENVRVRDPEKVGYLEQTTLSRDEAAPIRAAVLRRFPRIYIPRASDICFATQNRQDGVKKLIEEGAEAIIGVGSKTSANSTRLVEVAESTFLKTKGPNETDQPRALFINNVSDLDLKDVCGRSCIGIVSGASTPEHLFDEVVSLFTRGGALLEEILITDKEQNMRFALPKI